MNKKKESLPQFHEGIVSSNRILYTASDFAKQSLMYLQEIGELVANKPHKSSRDNLSSFLFFIVESGSGKLYYEGEETELEEGDAVFINCSKGYSHETSLNLWKLKWIHFSGNSVKGIYDKYVERGGQSVLYLKKTEALDNLKKVWEELLNIAKSDDYIRDMKINTGLSKLTELLMNESWNPEGRGEKSTKRDLSELRRYLEEHFTEKITLEDLSERFYINKFYLTRIFKERYGTSIGSYLQNLKITEAKRKLRFTDLSIQEIGEECGLGDLAYFSRIFKKVEGISPTEYRNKW